MRDFRKYDVWQLGHQFCLSIYKISQTFPKEELYGLSSQIRRAALSVPTNISEGCGRQTDKEFAHFLNIALGSALETENLIIISKDLNYISLEQYTDLNNEINLIKKKLYHLHKILFNK